MTIGDQIKALAEVTRKRGTIGVYILERALVEVLECETPSSVLVHIEGKRCYEYPGYKKLAAQDAEESARIDELLADHKKVAS